MVALHARRWSGAKHRSETKFRGVRPNRRSFTIVESTYLDLEIPRNFDFSHWFGFESGGGDSKGNGGGLWEAPSSSCTERAHSPLSDFSIGPWRGLSVRFALSKEPQSGLLPLVL